MPVSGVASVFKTSEIRLTDVLYVFGLSRWKRLRHVLGTNVFHTFWVQTSSTRYQNVSAADVVSVFQTSGRRFANILDVSGLSRWTRVQHVVGRNVFHTLSERVRFRCSFRFQNVRKTFCKRFGRLRFVTLFR